MNQYDFPIIVRNKIRVIIFREHTTMYSTSYYDVIKVDGRLKDMFKFYLN